LGKQLLHQQRVLLLRFGNGDGTDERRVPAELGAVRPAVARLSQISVDNL
jgi:hypothetical protein